MSLQEKGKERAACSEEKNRPTPCDGTGHQASPAEPAQCTLTDTQGEARKHLHLQPEAQPLIDTEKTTVQTAAVTYRHEKKLHICERYHEVSAITQGRKDCFYLKTMSTDGPSSSHNLKTRQGRGGELQTEEIHPQAFAH